MNEYRQFNVTALVTTRMTFVVSARTPEQAEDLVEELIADGEVPFESDPPTVELEEVVPVDSLTSDEVFPE